MGTAGDMATREDRILWNIVTEHFEEACWAFRAWTRALESPVQTLGDVERKIEERLLAHLDGLVVGGDAVARRLLEPEWAGGPDVEKERLVAAGAALMGQGRQDAVEPALWASNPLVSDAALHVLSLFGSAHTDAWVAAQLADSHPRTRGRVVQLAAARGVVVASPLASLQSDDIDERIAGLVAARLAPASQHLRFVQEMAYASEWRVRDAALVTGLILGWQQVMDRCVELARDGEAPQPTPTLLVALFGDRMLHYVLTQHLAEPSHRAAALRAIGFSGNVTLIDAILPHLASDDRRVARLAGEAISNLTGIDAFAPPYAAHAPEDADSLPPLEDDDLDANLVPDAKDDLPVPNAAAFTAFWRARASSFDPRSRLLWGKPWTLERALQGLSVAPMRQRHPLALWVEVRTGGHARISTRALSRTQRRQIEVARSTRDVALSA